MYQATKVLLVSLMILSLAACATRRFEGGWPPENSRVIAKGFDINVPPPGPGVLVLVDDASGRILETVDANELGTFRLTRRELAAAAKELGHDLSEMEPVLYYAPASDKEAP